MLRVADRQLAAAGGARIGDRRSRPESDIPEIDLIGAGQAAVSAEAGYLSGECRRFIKYQGSGRAVKLHGHGIRGCKFQRAASCNRCGGADHAVAVEVLVEGVLQRLQRDAVSRHVGDEIREIVAVAVGAPHRVLAGARVFQGDIVAATRYLFRADQRPACVLTDRYGRAATLQFGAGAAADVFEIVVVADLKQAGRAGRIRSPCRQGRWCRRH